MNANHVKMTFLLSTVLSCAGLGLSAQTGEAPFVYLRPEQTRLWNTVAGGDVTLPVAYPPGASSATLTVTAPGCSRVYPEIVGRDVTISLPAAADASTEAVYELTLVFDNAAVQKARLAVISGYAAGNAGATGCRLPYGDRRWGRVKGDSAVVPIPSGATGFSVDGVEPATFDGTASWQQVSGIQSADRELELDTTAGTQTAVLSAVPGLGISVR